MVTPRHIVNSVNTSRDRELRVLECRLFTACFCMILIVSSCLSSVIASDKPVWRPGQRVRVEYDTTVTKRILYVIPYSDHVVREAYGKLISWDSDSVVISVDYPKGDETTVTTSAVRKAYVGEGQRRFILEGMGLGAAGGFLLWLMAHMEVPPPTEETWASSNPGSLFAALVGGSVVAGGILGWLTKVDRWREVDRNSWAVEPGFPEPQRTIGVELTFRF